MRTAHAFALLTAFVAGTAPTADARPPHKKALADHFGPLLHQKLNDCRTCHQAPRGDQAEDRPHNAFGARLKQARKELARAGQKTDIMLRFRAIADEDSDGDGVSNLLELLSGHNPGEPDDTPTAAELPQARAALAAYQARQQAYAWQPFEPVRRPAVPTVTNGGWVRNPVDAFVAAEHERHGLRPRPEAPRPVLLRRVYLDLIGLPPTREELRASLDDPAPDAYERVVDRLLASPQYGERWGRHWMDVWRYSDWYREVFNRDSQPHIWRWRDWIVESLNADQGYDRMVREMLAADELAPDDPGALRATGFLARDSNPFDRNLWLNSTVEHTSKAFLGVTLNCARCHDHMFDTDITQKDYYRFRAFFEPYNVRIDRVPGQPDLARDGLPRAYDADPAAPTFLFVRGDGSRPDKSAALPPGVPAALGGAVRVAPVPLPRAAYSPDTRAFVVAETVAASAAALAAARTALDSARRTAAAAPLATGPLAAAEREVALAEARHEALQAALRAERLEEAGRQNSAEWRRAATEANAAQRKAAALEARKNLRTAREALGRAPEAMRAEAAKKAAAAAALARAEADEKLPPAAAYARRPVKTYPRASSGRRLALARWVTDRQNPLAARVAVNHIWLRHFGSALVPSVFDFGRNGQPSTHPALHDWLAAEFMEKGWGMKSLHRLLVTSAAYRMASSTDRANVALDPENRYLWRTNTRRMEAEVVRDSVLYLAGRLDLTRGGPDIDHQLGESVPRRSLYFRHAPLSQMEFLTVFDAADVNECYRRTESVVPQQGLALANSALVLAQSRRLAAALTGAVGDRPTDPVNAAFVRAAFEQVLGRPPTAPEQAECEKFLREQAALLADVERLAPITAGAAAPVPASPVPHLRARENLVHVLINHNDFVTIR